MAKKITVLGATGSIGVQALEVCSALGYTVTALTGNRNAALLEEQVRRFRPSYAVTCDHTAYEQLKVALGDMPVKVLYGPEGLCEVAALGQNDIVLNAVVGIAGLRPTLAALQAGNEVALANKETLVTGGQLVTGMARQKGLHILPVDSEHSAIFQSIGGFDGHCRPQKIILTASGGPFFGKKREDLRGVTVEQALKHPNWSMGAKITVDSATLMNKGLEVIEAVWLFDLPADQIEVVVHRQSIVHSLVEFADHSVIGQLGVPDMKIPIQYALTYPERTECHVEPLSLTKVGTLTFAPPDLDTFVCLPACIRAIERGGLCPAAVNGANEAAVAAFLQGQIGFLDIGDLIAEQAEQADAQGADQLDAILEADREARSKVAEKIACLQRRRVSR